MGEKNGIGATSSKNRTIISKQMKFKTLTDMTSGCAWHGAQRYLKPRADMM